MIQIMSQRWRNCILVTTYKNYFYFIKWPYGSNRSFEAFRQLLEHQENKEVEVWTFLQQQWFTKPMPISNKAIKHVIFMFMVHLVKKTALSSIEKKKTSYISRKRIRMSLFIFQWLQRVGKIFSWITTLKFAKKHGANIVIP